MATLALSFPCPRCGRPTRPLFTSRACDPCDGLVLVGIHTGFVVFRGDPDLEGRPVYVFRTRTDAARWRAHRNLRDCPILEVRAEWPIAWTTAKGDLDGVQLAARPYELFADHRFPPGPNRAFLWSIPRVRAA